MMKPLLFLIAVLFALHGQAQTVFAPPNSIWYYGVVDADGNRGLSYQKYAMEKDTIFMGHLSSKVTAEHHAAAPGTTKLPTQFTYTSGDTVFYYNFDFGQFLPLYIFNVSVGDTLKFHVPFAWASPPDSFRVVVTAVSSVTIDGLLLREIKTTYLDQFALDTYTERIGNKYFIGHRPVPITGYVNYLRCYKDGAIDTQFTTEPCDYLKTTSINENMVQDRIELYPNPFLNQINVKVETGLAGLSIELYNVMGAQQRVAQITYSNGVCTINTKELPAGLYFVRVKNEKQETIFYKALLKS